MKKLIFGIVILVMLMVTGCALNTNVPVNAATDILFVGVLQNNPAYKAPVIAALQSVKVYLNGSVTYDDLMLFITKQFGPKYIYVGIILSDYIAADTPVFETWLPMFDEYKVEINRKIDRLIILASM